MHKAAQPPPFAYTEALAAAEAAGQVLMQHYDAPLQVQHKADHSPVTQADLAAQHCIVEHLQRAYPDIPLISEEATLPPLAERQSWARFWLVDPLDGTKEFIHHNGEFTVNIALIAEGIPVFGVIAVPAQGTLYVGCQTQGSWRYQGGQWERLQCQRKSLQEPLRLVCSRSHPSPELEAWEAAHRISERVPVGSSLKFCRVAEGQADVYVRFHAIREWDVAAGDAIYRYASAGAPHPSALVYNSTDLWTVPFMVGVNAVVPVLP